MATAVEVGTYYENGLRLVRVVAIDLDERRAFVEDAWTLLEYPILISELTRHDRISGRVWTPVGKAKDLDVPA